VEVLIMAFYTSHGAAGEVTGSCHLIEIGKIKILIDCGMFQGQEEELNFEPFKFNPKDINYLIVTHAHLDHIGRVPLLVKEGFNGSIISTKATYSISRLMLKNSAGILENKKEKLYSINDIEPTLKLFDTFLESDESINLNENIQISFKNAGHILGAVSVKVEFIDEGIEKSIIFSGDIGQNERIITSPVKYWDNANTLFIESTYGASLHQPLNISIENFKEQILETIKKSGTVVIPSFALERTQEILYLLRGMSLKDQLKGVTVYLDSPLAIDVTKTFLQFPHLFGEDVKEILKEGKNPFNFKELVETYSKENSELIESNKNAKIIIAGSGMCEGGRVGSHLLKYINDEKNLILFVGYQVEKTLGKKISSKDKDVKILGTHVDVKAKIGYASGFSAHADQKDILEWINNIKNLYIVYLIHGDIEKEKILKQKIKDELKEKVHIVKLGEKIHI
jgi:metallo-beta-lactamase family protein